MKKIDILNLIKSHMSGDEKSFRTIAYEIANDFYESGDVDLSKSIIGFLSQAYSYSTQDSNVLSYNFIKKVNIEKNDLYLPTEISDDIKGLENAIKNDIHINKFLFYGAPGTGKTVASSLLAKRLGRELWSVNISELIDSKLGATAKNISQLFDDINELGSRRKLIVLFDEIDALVMNRIDQNDLREMGRATTEFFKGLDGLNQNIILIGTTNLYDNFDRALLRRFNFHISFSRYSKEDLIEIAMYFYDKYIDKFNFVNPNRRLVKKMLSSLDVVPYPGEIKNIIYASLAFSNPQSESEHLIRLFKNLYSNENYNDYEKLHEKGFTLRDIELITKKSKSTIYRRLKYEE